MIKRIVAQCLFMLVSAVIAGPAYAQTVVPDTYWYIGAAPRFNFDKSNPDVACRLFLNGFTNGWTYHSSDPPVGNFAKCYYRHTAGYKAVYGDVKKVSCPANLPYFTGAVSGGTTSYAGCSASKDEPPASCPKPPSGGTGEFPRGDANGNTRNVFPDAVVTGVCVDRCNAVVKDIPSCQTYPPSKQGYCTYRYEFTGTECAGSETPPRTGSGEVPPVRSEVPPSSPPPGKSCPGGTVQGGVDSAGTPICIGTGSAPQNSPPPPPKIELSQSEATPDGGTKTTDTTTTKNSDGSTTTETKTTVTAPDGTRTVTVTKDTSTSLGGTPGKDDSKHEDDKYDLCKKNPMLNICRNSEVSGSCGEITCMGDAIQCATLRAAAAMQCEQQADKEALTASPSKALGDQILSGNDPMKGDIAAALKGTEVDLSKTALDQGGFVGAGSCFPDKTFMVVGKPVTVSFARVCQDIQPLRAAVMACAFIVAYLIVGRSVVQG